MPLFIRSWEHLPLLPLFTRASDDYVVVQWFC